MLRNGHCIIGVVAFANLFCLISGAERCQCACASPALEESILFYDCSKMVNGIAYMPNLSSEGHPNQPYNL
jgi:hypothetical protein